jgi:hypothetical protein
MKKTIAAISMCAMMSIAGCAEDKPSGDGISSPPGSNDDGYGEPDDGATGPDGGDPGNDGESGDGGGDGTGETGADDGGSGTDTGGVFIQQPDGGDNDIECDVWAQDCDPGQKCMPWANDGGNSWNATKCSDLDANPKQPGDECTVEGSGVSGVDDCDVASMCWDVDSETNVGYCVPLCSGTPDAPSCGDPETVCAIYNDGVLPLCLYGCDPLLQDCANDDVCVPAPGEQGFVCVLDASGEGGQYGDPCEFVNVCDRGLFCAVAAAVPGCAGSLG